MPLLLHCYTVEVFQGTLHLVIKIHQGITDRSHLMSIYTIEPERATLHGTFSREYPPVLTIDPGDSVRFRTLDAGWNEGGFTAEGKPIKFAPRDKERDGGHALCGPIAIHGAQPGMTLEIRINEVRPALCGWTAGRGWDSN